MSKIYLITGATGFVGRNIIKRLFEEDSSCCVKLLVRSGKGHTGKERAEKMFNEIFTPVEYQQYKNNIEIIEGNITEYRFGLSESSYNSLAKSVNIIFHSAASIKFKLSLESAININVAGTKNILEFAEQCYKNNVLEKVNHISTAYVTGKKKKSNDTTETTLFCNTYEQSKFESEKIVQSYIKKGIPVTIFRPSIISGNTITGEITTNNIIYMFLLMISRESLPCLPCNTDSSLNIIPIDFFIDTMFMINRRSGTQGMVFNITNSKNTNVIDLITYAAQLLDVKAPAFIPVNSYVDFSDPVFNQIESFIPYFEESHYFDLTTTCAFLGTNSLICEDIRYTLDIITNYCYSNRLIRRRGQNTARNNNENFLVINN